MSDIRNALTFLHDGLPQWLHDVASLQDKVAAMQHDLAKVPATPLAIPKHKTDSTASIRHDAQTDPVANRKRKTLSLASGHASGPLRYRPRTMVVVSYDGDVQKSFELLVRAIGTARNMLRKAMMEAKMNELAALAGSSEDDDDDDDDADPDNINPNDAIVSKISYRPRMASIRAHAAARRTHAPRASTELFDATDKQLEHAQQQSERAAHLTLRDGDCRTELHDVRKNLENVLNAIRTEVNKVVVRPIEEAPGLQSHDTSDTSVSSVEPSYKRHFPHINTPPSVTASPCKGPLPATSAPTDSLHPKIIDIEVDDQADDDEDDFVMPPVRLTSRLAART